VIKVRVRGRSGGVDTGMVIGGGAGARGGGKIPFTFCD